MKKCTPFTILLMIMSINIYSFGDIEHATLPESKEKISQENLFFKTINGYMRVGYQHDDNTNTDLALGGKLHAETKSWNGISTGASLYSTNQIGQHNGAGIAFFDADNHSYTILAEAYIKGEWGNTLFKIGRQEINTPFADRDDVGMVPNTFEAAVLINKDITNTTVFLAQLQRWAGVDSNNPDHFTKLNNNKGIQVLGITYEGLKNTTLSGWFYNIEDAVKISYLHASYEGENNTLTYSFLAQYVLQDYNDNTQSTIYGIGGTLGHKKSGLTASLNYNKVNGRAAENFFGGGPYLTNAEHHTLSEAGRDGDNILYGLAWDASSVGLNGLLLSTNIDRHSNGTKDDTNEYDLVASYDYNDNVNFSVIYSNIDDSVDSFKNLRVFMNYTF